MGEWIESRLKHPVNLGDLLYFEPADIYTVRKEERNTAYYYPRTDNQAFLLVGKLNAEYEFSDSDDFNYDELVDVFMEDNWKLVDGVEVDIDGMKGRKYYMDAVFHGKPAKIHLLIIPLNGYAYTFDFTELYDFSEQMVRFEENIIRDIRNNHKSSENPSIIDENDFEARLNQGEKLDGVLLRFKVIKVCPDINSILGGYNIWSGEHLNLISDKRPTVKDGEELVVRVLYSSRTLGNSWAVYYEDLDEKGDMMLKKWADYSTTDLMTLLKKCITVSASYKEASPIPNGVVFTNYLDVYDKEQKRDESNNPLTLALRCLNADNNGHTFMEFYSVLRKYCQENKWVLFPVKSETDELMVVYIEDKEYAVMFSEQQFIKAGEGISIIAADINKLLEVAIEGELQGLIINPFSENKCRIDKEVLIKLCK